MHQNNHSTSTRHSVRGYGIIDDDILKASSSTDVENQVYEDDNDTVTNGGSSGSDSGGRPHSGEGRSAGGTSSFTAITVVAYAVGAVVVGVIGYYVVTTYVMKKSESNPSRPKQSQLGKELHNGETEVVSRGTSPFVTRGVPETTIGGDVHNKSENRLHDNPYVADFSSLHRWIPAPAPQSKFGHSLGAVESGFHGQQKHSSKLASSRGRKKLRCNRSYRGSTRGPLASICGHTDSPFRSYDARGTFNYSSVAAAPLDPSYNVFGSPSGKTSRMMPANSANSFEINAALELENCQQKLQAFLLEEGGATSEVEQLNAKVIDLEAIKKTGFETALVEQDVQKMYAEAMQIKKNSASLQAELETRMRHVTVLQESLGGKHRTCEEQVKDMQVKIDAQEILTKQKLEQQEQEAQAKLDQVKADFDREVLELKSHSSKIEDDLHRTQERLVNSHRLYAETVAKVKELQDKEAQERAGIAEATEEASNLLAKARESIEELQKDELRIVQENEDLRSQLIEAGFKTEEIRKDSKEAQTESQLLFEDLKKKILVEDDIVNAVGKRSLERNQINDELFTKEQDLNEVEDKCSSKLKELLGMIPNSVETKNISINTEIHSCKQISIKRLEAFNDWYKFSNTLQETLHHQLNAVELEISTLSAAGEGDVGSTKELTVEKKVIIKALSTIREYRKDSLAWKLETVQQLINDFPIKHDDLQELLSLQNYHKILIEEILNAQNAMTKVEQEAETARNKLELPGAGAAPVAKATEECCREELQDAPILIQNMQELEKDLQDMSEHGNRDELMKKMRIGVAHAKEILDTEESIDGNKKNLRDASKLSDDRLAEILANRQLPSFS